MKVKDTLNGTERQLLVNLDEGFYIFGTLRNSIHQHILTGRKKIHFL